MDRNEAIKIIRSNFPIGRIMLCEALETLIPELKESEDERKEFVATQYEEVIEQYPCSAAPTEIKVLSYTVKTFDWLNEHYFDYRGLIEKGLAIKVTEENNPYKD